MADEHEAIRQWKARYCRFLDAKDADGWRSVFSDDLAVKLDRAASTRGADVGQSRECSHNAPSPYLGNHPHFARDSLEHLGTWRIKTLHLTRTIQQIAGDDA